MYCAAFKKGIVPASIGTHIHQHTHPPTHTINKHYQHILSTHTINKHYQHILSTHTLNTHYQHTLPTHTPCQHTPSTHHINTRTQCSNGMHHTSSDTSSDAPPLLTSLSTHFSRHPSTHSSTLPSCNLILLFRDPQGSVITATGVVTSPFTLSPSARVTVGLALVSLPYALTVYHVYCVLRLSDGRMSEYGNVLKSLTVLTTDCCRR